MLTAESAQFQRFIGSSIIPKNINHGTLHMVNLWPVCPVAWHCLFEEEHGRINTDLEIAIFHIGK